MNIKSTALAIAAVLALPTAASAATFDFVDMADTYKAANGGKEATYDQMVGFNAGYFVGADVSIDDIAATGTGLHGFFDGGTAGLGVCSTASQPGSSISGCSSSGGVNTADDNVTVGEGLAITFSKVVNLTDLFFRNSGHPPLTGELAINGTTYDVTNGMLSAADLASLGSHKVWNFDYTSDQFYLSTATAISAVPLPAGLLLMGTALGGLGLMRRRKKA